MVLLVLSQALGRLWIACGRISASGPAGGTRSLFTNIFKGVSPQRRNTVLSFATFCSGLFTVVLILFIFQSPALSSPVFGFLRPDAHIFESLQLNEGQQRKNARRSLSRRGPCHRARGAPTAQQSLSKTSSENADPANPSADAESSLPRPSGTAVCFP